MNTKLKNQDRVFIRREKMEDVFRPTHLRPEVRMAAIPRVQTKTQTFARNVAVSGMVLTFLLSSVGITYGKMEGTGAFFADTETSTLNRFVANILDFVGHGPAENIKVTPLASAVPIPVTITSEPGSVETKFLVSVEQTGGDIPFCTALVASVASPFVYGPSPLLSLTGSATGDPSFTLFISYGGVPTIETCTFDVIFRGWDARVPGETGYTDVERVTITVTDPPAEEPLEIVVEGEVDSEEPVPTLEVVIPTESVGEDVPEAGGESEITDTETPAEEPEEADALAGSVEEPAPETPPEPAPEPTPAPEVIEVPPPIIEQAIETPSPESAPEPTPEPPL